MGMNYTQYVSFLVDLLETTATTPEFVAILPACINDAEQRMYRELDLLATVARFFGSQFQPGLRNITTPSGSDFNTDFNNDFGGVQWITIQEINVITPSNIRNPEFGSRSQMMPVSKEYLNAVYGSVRNSGVPKYFAPIDDKTYIVGPWPDQAYTIEFTGTIRPVPLSATNPNTVLTNYLPDAFLAASMIFMAGYQRNFGRMADDPQMSVTWQSHYNDLMKSAIAEAARQKFQESAWSSMSIPVAATPNR